MKVIKTIFKVVMILVVLAVMTFITIGVIDDLFGNYFGIIHAAGLSVVAVFALILFKIVKD